MFTETNDSFSCSIGLEGPKEPLGRAGSVLRSVDFTPAGEDCCGCSSETGITVSCAPPGSLFLGVVGGIDIC